MYTLNARLLSGMVKKWQGGRTGFGQVFLNGNGFFVADRKGSCQSALKIFSIKSVGCLSVLGT